MQTFEPSRIQPNANTLSVPASMPLHVTLGLSTLTGVAVCVSLLLAGHGWLVSAAAGWGVLNAAPAALAAILLAQDRACAGRIIRHRVNAAA